LSLELASVRIRDCPEIWLRSLDVIVALSGCGRQD